MNSQHISLSDGEAVGSSVGSVVGNAIGSAVRVTGTEVGLGCGSALILVYPSLRHGITRPF